MPTPNAPKKPLVTPKALMILGIAFAIGLLLFLLLWLDQRNDSDFFKGGPAATGSTEVDALPAPLPPDLASDGDNASGLRLPTTENPGSSRSGQVSEQPRIINEPAPAPAPVPVFTPPAPAIAADRATPVPLSNPAPRYPQEALRRGIQGSVQVRAMVAADGSVERLELARGSGNKHLDRAAMEAVRRWRFQPATRAGQPISAEIMVPIEFNLGR